MTDHRIPYLISSALLVSLVSCETESVSDTPKVTAESFRSTYAEDLELHWTFEDRSGNTIYDMSGNGRHGTLIGGSFVSAPWGDAVTLDGVNDKITFSGPRDPDDFGGATTGSFTVAAHVRVDDVDRNNTLCIGCAPFSNLVIGSDNVGPRVVAGLYDETATNSKTFATSDQSLVDDTWTHVTMVVEAGVGTTFYINCEENMVRPNEDVELHDYNYSSVGESGNPSNWYEGEIDDLKVWSRALSEEEIEDLCPCGGAPEAYTLGISFPKPPATALSTSYDPPDPSGTVAWVSPADLENDPDGLQAKVTADYDQIVLEDGVYTADHVTGDWLTIDGQKLWAETPGGVTLEFAVHAGDSTPGSELHGLVFDIDDEDNAQFFGDEQNPHTNHAGRAAISAEHDATGLVVEDCVIRGDGIDTGVYLHHAGEDFEARRLEIHGLTRFGLYVTDNGGSILTNPMIVEDIRIWDMDHPTELHGVGVKLGEKADVSRVHIRDARRNGLVLYGDSTSSNVDYVDIDRVGTTEAPAGVGVYFDGMTVTTTLEHFCIGPEVRIGVNAEWDNCPQVDQPDCDNDPNYHARTIFNTVEYGLIEALWVGVNFEQGTIGGDVNHVTFRNYSRAAIAFHNNVSTTATWPYYDDGSSQSDNTFEEAEVNCEICDLTYTQSVTWGLAPQCVGEPACP